MGNGIERSLKESRIGLKNVKVIFKRLVGCFPNVDFKTLHEIEFELDSLLEEEEIYWKQRSREVLDGFTRRPRLERLKTK